MALPLMHNVQIPKDFDIEGAEMELIEKLEDGAKYKIEEGEEHQAFFKRLMAEFDENI